MKVVEEHKLLKESTIGHSVYNDQGEGNTIQALLYTRNSSHSQKKEYSSICQNSDFFPVFMPL